MAMFTALGRYTNFGLLILRIGLGAMMILHGFPKLSGGPERWERVGAAVTHVGIHFTPVFWGFMAGLSETLGGLLMMIGLFFRPACIFLIITMTLAAINHLQGGDTLLGASHPIELAFVFLGLFFIGPGRFSIDKK